MEEIIRYIDADSIRDIPVGDIPAEVEQLQTEMSSPSDKLIWYNTHFKSVNQILGNERLCIICILIWMPKIKNADYVVFASPL